MTNNITNPYDALYTNLKNRFTVVHDGCEFTVADFMLMKAGKQNSSKESSLTVSPSPAQRTISTIVTYFNDKLTLKVPAEKDKTIKRFPIRTSTSAMLSAVAACALVFSYGIFALLGVKSPSTTDVSEYSNSQEFHDNEHIDEQENIIKHKLTF